MRIATILALVSRSTDFPAFDPKIRAVYYVRVLKDPVCRWSTHDAHRLKVDQPKAVPATIGEWVWTSPIWYTP
jgi:hypothetical protein